MYYLRLKDFVLQIYTDLTLFILLDSDHSVLEYDLRSLSKILCSFNFIWRSKWNSFIKGLIHIRINIFDNYNKKLVLCKQHVIEVCHTRIKCLNLQIKGLSLKVLFAKSCTFANELILNLYSFALM